MAFIRKSTKPKLVEDFSQGENLSTDERFTVTQLLELARRNGVETSPLDVKALLLVLGIALISIPMSDEI